LSASSSPFHQPRSQGLTVPKLADGGCGGGSLPTWGAAVGRCRALHCLAASPMSVLPVGLASSLVCRWRPWMRCPPIRECRGNGELGLPVSFLLQCCPPMGYLGMPCFVPAARPRRVSPFGSAGGRCGLGDALPFECACGSRRGECACFVKFSAVWTRPCDAFRYRQRHRRRVVDSATCVRSTAFVSHLSYGIVISAVWRRRHGMCCPSSAPMAWRCQGLVSADQSFSFACWCFWCNVPAVGSVSSVPVWLCL
jgi:hypothetical protein